MKEKKERNSNIEALKILAILSIVTSHVVLSLETKSAYISSNAYLISLSHATDNVQNLIASMMRYGGEFGNTIFFICSAWFLLEDNRHVNKKKIMYMLADVWVVSVLLLLVVFACTKGQLSGRLILQSFFPTTFENNWYITCYIIFYIIHPFLNFIIDSIQQKTLLRLNALAFTMYFIIAFSCRVLSYLLGAGTEFFSSRLVIWTVIYFMLAYIKLYADEICNRKKYNVWLIAFGFIGNSSLIMITNILGMKFNIFAEALQIWIVPYNPFLLALGVGLLGLARSSAVENKVINYTAGLSLYIYIIHENLLLRLIYRPLMWKYIYERFGYEYILCWILILTAVVFAFALLVSIVYCKTIRRLTIRVCDYSFHCLAKIWNNIEKCILDINTPS